MLWCRQWSVVDFYCCRAFWPVSRIPLYVSVAGSDWCWSQAGCRWHLFSGYTVSPSWCVLHMQCACIVIVKISITVSCESASLLSLLFKLYFYISLLKMCFARQKLHTEMLLHDGSWCSFDAGHRLTTDVYAK